MGYRPFYDRLGNARAVQIPPLDGDRRERFLARVAAAVKQQAGLARKCDAILRVTGETVVDGGRILIPHEPASPLDLGAIIGSESRPAVEDALWTTAALLRALSASAAERVIHGSIQPASIYLDEAGALKLGDFGVVPAFESACGIPQRRFVHCNPLPADEPGGRVLSGTWSLLSEEDARDTGWSAAFFAHELLGDQQPLHVKSDQFAAGVVLFLLTTAGHPFGASLADPTMTIYFQLDPYPLGDERKDWAASFERQAQNLAGATDKPILALGEVYAKLLAADPAARYAALSEAEERLKEFVPAEWAEIGKAVRSARALLDAGDAEGFLGKLAPWRESAALPECARDRLGAWYALVEEQKDVIARKRALARQLAAAQNALERVELDRARELAGEIVRSSDADEDVRIGAENLLKIIAEQAEFIASGADALAVHYLDAARQALEAGDTPAARETLNVVLADDGMAQTRRSQARQLLAEVELLEQRIARQTAELGGARAELSAGKLSEAQQRLEALERENELPPAQKAELERLIADVAAAGQRREEWSAALAAADAAWAAADAGALDAALARVPSPSGDPTVDPRRAEIQTRGAALATAQAKRAEAETALESQRPRKARAAIEAALSVGELPEGLAAELRELRARCDAEVSRQQAAARAAAEAGLAEAQAAYDQALPAACVERLADLLDNEDTPDDVLSAARNLREQAERVAEAVQALDAARAATARGDFASADQTLDRIDPASFPPKIGEQARALRSANAAARAEHAQKQTARLRDQLTRAADALAAGELADCAALLAGVEADEALDPALRRDLAPLQKHLRESRDVEQRLRAAESEAETDPAQCDRLIDALPTELPAWAARRAADCRQRAARARAEQRQAEIRYVTDELSAAEQALERGEPDAAGERLAALGDRANVEPRLAARREAHRAQCDALRKWLAQLDGLRAALESGRWLDVVRDAQPLLAGGSVPPVVREQLRALTGEAEQRIAAARGALDETLADLAQKLAQRRRRPRYLRELESIGADALATEPQRAQAQDLAARFAALPVRRTKVRPWMIAIPAALALSLGSGWVALKVLHANGAKRTTVSPSDNATLALGDRENAQERLAVANDNAAIPSTQLAARDSEPRDEESPTDKPSDSTHLTVAAGDDAAHVQEPPTPDKDNTDVAASQPVDTAPRVPTFAEASEALLPTIWPALPGGIADGRIVEREGSGVRIALTWHGSALIPFDGAFDAGGGTFSMSAADVAAWFRPQIEALQALGAPDALAIRVDPRYDARLHVAGAPRLLRAGEQVELEVPLKLKGDPRGDAVLRLPARVADGALTPAGEAGSAVFADFLGALQSACAARDMQAAGQLSLGGGLTIQGPTDFRGGDSLPLEIRDRRGPLATFAGAWKPDQLDYTIDVAMAKAALRSGLRSRLEESESLAALRTTWPPFCAELKLPADAPGVGALSAYKLVQITPVDDQSRTDPFVIEVSAKLAPSVGDTDADAIHFAAQVRYENGASVWDSSAAAHVRAILLAELSELAEDPELRRRRQQAALAALADELKVNAAGWQPVVRGDRLRLDIAHDGAPRRFEWTWDPVRLTYLRAAEFSRDRVLADLARLSSGENVAAEDFVAALADVGRLKAAAFAAAEYQVDPQVCGAAPARERLAALSAALRRVAAPEGGRAPQPRAFVEYIADGKAGVFALAWRSGGAPGEVSDTRVWKALSANELSSFADAAAARAAYSVDAKLGERLLGPALGAAIRGGPDGGFGLMIAPDGPLWLTRWEQIRFNSRDVEGVGPPGGPARVENLRGLLEPRAAEVWPRAAIWCVPTLTGAWRGSPADARLTLGEIVPGKEPYAARFRAHGDGSPLFAVIEDRSRAGDFQFAEYAKRVQRDEIGTTFWDRAWRGEVWQGTPYVSFSLLRSEGP